MLQICSNIVQARKSAGKTQQQMADLLKVKRSSYSNWESNTEPDMPTLKAIAQITGKTINFLINDPEELLPIVNEQEATYLQRRQNLKTTKEETLMYYEIGANAGLKEHAEVLPVKRSEGRLHIGDLFKGSDYAIRISGNSMTPSYPPGAIIGIREIPDKQITPGSVYVIEKDSDLWIKRLFYKEDNRESGEFELVSDNTMKSESGSRAGKLYYPSFTISIDEVRKLFKVTGIYKANELTVIT